MNIDILKSTLGTLKSVIYLTVYLTLSYIIRTSSIHIIIDLNYDVIRLTFTFISIILISSKLIHILL